MHLLVVVILLLILFKLDDLTAPVVPVVPPAPVDPVIAALEPFHYAIAAIVFVIAAWWVFKWIIGGRL